MAIDYLGIPFPKGNYEQPEDNLRYFIETVHGEAPTNHYPLSEFTNKWLGRKVTYFSTSVPVKDIINDLKKNLPVVLSGTFPGYPNKLAEPLGHIVTLVGAVWDGNDEKKDPDQFIIDDPYGNTLDNWRGSGNDVYLPLNLFIEWMKPINVRTVKWAHRFVN
jgi:hypothetical protein